MDDIETEVRNESVAGAEDRDEFFRLFDLLDDEGRERVLALARRYMRENCSAATANILTERGPVGRVRRLGRSPRK